MILAILVGNPNYYIFVFALISGDGAVGVTRLTSLSVCRVESLLIIHTRWRTSFISEMLKNFYVQKSYIN